jgi:hypothetical protein
MAIIRAHEWVHGDAQGTHVEELSTIYVSSECISAVQKTPLSQTRTLTQAQALGRLVVEGRGSIEKRADRETRLGWRRGRPADD